MGLKMEGHMSHVDEGMLHALVDGQLSDEERRAVEAHVATCAACASELADASRLASEVRGLLTTLDVPASSVTRAPATAVAPVVAPDVVPITAARRRWLSPQRMAIAASLLAVAGISYRVGRDTSVPTANVAVNAPAVRPAVPVAAAPRVATTTDSQVLASAPLASAMPRDASGPRVAESVERDAATEARERRQLANAAPPTPVTASPGEAMVASATPLGGAAGVAAARERTTNAGVDAEKSQPAQTAQNAVTQQAPPSQPYVAQQQVPPARVNRADDAARDAASDGRVLARAEQRVESRAEPRGEPRGESRAAAPAPSRAPMAEPPSTNERARKSATVMAGYSVVDQEVRPGRTQVRYASGDGTVLTFIVESDVSEKAAEKRRDGAQTAAAQFTVVPGSPVSRVQWQSGGARHELRGALRPDSLLKLATLLR
jgi:anti-sigma factor RsiW